MQQITSRFEKSAQRNSTDDTTMLQRKFIGIFVKMNISEHSEKWYEHTPEGAVENEEIKILWDINIQCDIFI